MGYPSFPTRYYVGTIAGDPLRILTADLTMRTMRHTCVTINHDAGISRELIGSITGHSPQSIDEIMAHYTARTADQAEAALSTRVGMRPVAAPVSRSSARAGGSDQLTSTSTRTPA